MRIKSVHLQGYKRFTDLRVGEIPASARLVVLIGPNGSGKSSLFDAFLLKSQGTRNNYGLAGGRGDYYWKRDHTSGQRPDTTQQLWHNITIQFHTGEPALDGWPATFKIRSAYRNEADFSLTSLNRVDPSTETPRLGRIIDTDATVSNNYGRMAWKRMADLDKEASEETTFGQYRKDSLGELQASIESLFSAPTLQLQDFGGIQASGTFRFSKGTAIDFHYKNLSGGEKAAFDLLLDIFVNRSEYRDAIYCVDEPESHVATALHGRLLETMLGLVPEESQLWIATHSVGFVRKAYEMMQQNNDVVFLDFSGHDFDQKVKLTPRPIDRTFWKTTYKVALDDLSDLIAPKNIVICEGSKPEIDKGFDAKCYNEIFSEAHPDTLFISFGGSTQVENSEYLITLLERVAKGINVSRLIDRDNMTEDEREEKTENGIRVLDEREIENYLYAPEVLRTFLESNGKGDIVEEILQHRAHLLSSSTSTEDNVKHITQELLIHIGKLTRLPSLGSSREAFALRHLVPALIQTPCVFQKLECVVFP